MGVPGNRAPSWAPGEQLPQPIPLSQHILCHVGMHLPDDSTVQAQEEWGLHALSGLVPFPWRAGRQGTGPPITSGGRWDQQWGDRSHGLPGKKREEVSKGEVRRRSQGPEGPEEGLGLPYCEEEGLQPWSQPSPSSLLVHKGPCGWKLCPRCGLARGQSLPVNWKKVLQLQMNTACWGVELAGFQLHFSHHVPS